MATSTGSGSRSRYKTEGRSAVNKTKKGLKLVKGLEQRKAWRTKKYSGVPQAELSRTTRTLFKKWGVELIGPKSVAKPAVHKRWVRPNVEKA